MFLALPFNFHSYFRDRFIFCFHVDYSALTSIRTIGIDPFSLFRFQSSWYWCRRSGPLCQTFGASALQCSRPLALPCIMHQLLFRFSWCIPIGVFARWVITKSQRSCYIIVTYIFQKNTENTQFTMPSLQALVRTKFFPSLWIAYRMVSAYQIELSRVNKFAGTMMVFWPYGLLIRR